MAFARNPDLGELVDHAGLAKVRTVGIGLVSFQLLDDVHPNGFSRLVFEREAVCDYCRMNFQDVPADAGRSAICSVTGVHAPVARLHSKIRGISNPDGVKSEAVLVSYNKEAFESWGHKGSENSAVSVAAERAYTAALNSLVSSNTSRRPIGGVTYVVWTDGKQAKAPDPSLDALFGSDTGNDAEPAAASETPSALDLLRSVESGVRPMDDGVVCNVLGLQTAMGRAVVRFWRTGRQADMVLRVRQHFEDLGASQRRILPMWKLLAGLQRNWKDTNLPPALASGIVQAAFDGTPYPPNLLWLTTDRFMRSRPNTAVDGAATERWRNTVRIACITACLRRSARLGITQEDAPMALDRENTDMAYRLGRLFAVYESVQRAANPEVNTTLRDQLFGAAARNPARVFWSIETRSVHHLAKLRKTSRGLDGYFAKEIGEIMSTFPASGLPDRLGPSDVSRFAIGYHHQAASRKAAVAPDGTPQAPEAIHEQEDSHE